MVSASHAQNKTKVLIVGCGGLGCPVALALARSGRCDLTLMDDDVVERSNLHRQPWHHENDVGRLKVDSAFEKLRAQFPKTDLEAIAARLDANNGPALFARHDVVIDASDGIQTKFLLSQLAVETQVCLVHAGALRFEGLAMRIEETGPCLRCLFDEMPDDAPTCSQSGVLGSLVGVIGALVAELALVSNEAPGWSWLHLFDGLSLSMRRVKVKKRPDCEACGLRS
jgi:molybdopterin-synthase adenylyltransferase